MWYPMGGCSVHKPPFVRGPHVVQRALCPQGRPTAVKTKRDTGKASGSLFPSEKLSSVRLFKGRLWATRGVWIKTEIRWKRQRGRLARCKPSPNALGSMKGPWAGSKDHMPAHGAPGRGQSCSSIKQFSLLFYDASEELEGHHSHRGHLNTTGFAGAVQPYSPVALESSKTTNGKQVPASTPFPCTAQTPSSAINTVSAVGGEAGEYYIWDAKAQTCCFLGISFVLN